MVESLIEGVPYNSPEEVKTRVREVRERENLDTLRGRFWR